MKKESISNENIEKNVESLKREYDNFNKVKRSVFVSILLIMISIMMMYASSFANTAIESEPLISQTKDFLKIFSVITNIIAILLFVTGMIKLKNYGEKNTFSDLKSLFGSYEIEILRDSLIVLNKEDYEDLIIQIKEYLKINESEIDSKEENEKLIELIERKKNTDRDYLENKSSILKLKKEKIESEIKLIEMNKDPRTERVDKENIIRLKNDLQILYNVNSVENL